VALLERGEVHLGIRHDQGVDPHLKSLALQPDEVLAACAPSLHSRATETIDICSLASYPLLLLEPGYSVRVQFNAACRLANFKPNILFESRAPHTLLALAEARYGVAIIPSLLRTDRYELTILRLAHRGKPLREGLVIQWDHRRPMLPYAASFRDALAKHMRTVFSMTQPSKRKSALARKQAVVARARAE
jgi:DNA-binding transcriptional LysR family regulator